MRIKRLTAGLMACVLLAANLSTICFAAETGTDGVMPIDAATTEETITEYEDMQAESEDGSDSEDESTENSLEIPVESIEDLQAALDALKESASSESVTVGKVNVAASSYLNLRSGSSMDSGIIGHLFTGDELEIVGENGDWYQVVVKERTGYVYKDYVEVVEQPDAEVADGEMLTLLFKLMMSAQSGEDSGKNGSLAFTPDGNLTLVDDYSESYEDGSGKQFITVTTKSGNYFYLVIDRDEDGDENVHFMNLVDEADLLALMDEDVAAQYTQPTEPEEPVVTEPEEPVKDEEPVEEPEEKSGMNIMPVLILLLALIGGGGFFAFTKLKGKQKAQEQEKPDPDAEYMDDEDSMDFEIPEDLDDEEDESTMFDAEDDEPV